MKESTGKSDKTITQAEHLARASALPAIVAALAQARRERDLSIMARLAQMQE